MERINSAADRVLRCGVFHRSRRSAGDLRPTFLQTRHRGVFAERQAVFSSAGSRSSTVWRSAVCSAAGPHSLPATIRSGSTWDPDGR